jgi:hypothetical protein
MVMRAPMAITQLIPVWDSVQSEAMEMPTPLIVSAWLCAQEDLLQIIALCFACRYAQLILLLLVSKVTGPVLSIVLMICGLMPLLAPAIIVVALTSDLATSRILV